MGYNFQTSLPAYQSVINELGKNQKQVYVCLCEHGPLTNYEISKKLDWPINCITPRTCELVEMGLARPNGLRKCPTGRMGTVWEALVGKDAAQQQEVMF